VTTVEQGPFGEAEFFCTKLREFKMPLRAMVVNRVLPDVFRDPGGVAAATTLVEDPKVAAWLSKELRLRVSADTARFVGSTFLTRSTLAQREVRQLARLAASATFQSCASRSSARRSPSSKDWCASPKRSEPRADRGDSQP